MTLFQYVAVLLPLLYIGAAAAPRMDSLSRSLPSANISPVTNNGSATPLPAPSSPLLPSPLIYKIQRTDPPIWLHLFNTEVQTPIELYRVSYAVIYGLEQTVLDCITARGDFPLSDNGFRIVNRHVGIVIQNRPRSVVRMTHSSTASVLRGLWEVMYGYGPKTVVADIYVGGQLGSNLLGKLVVYKDVGNASTVGVS